MDYIWREELFSENSIEQIWGKCKLTEFTMQIHLVSVAFENLDEALCHARTYLPGDIDEIVLYSELHTFVHAPE